MGLQIRRAAGLIVLAAAMATGGCGPKVYQLSLLACTSNVSYKESLARMDDQPNTPRYQMVMGETGVFAVSRYQLARLKGASRAGPKASQFADREETVREGERKDFSLATPTGGRLRVSTALSSDACCAGIAFVKTSVAVEEAGGKVRVVFDCDLPLARMVLVELRPVGDPGLWTWVVLDARKLEDSGAAGAPKAGR